MSTEANKIVLAMYIVEGLYQVTDSETLYNAWKESAPTRNNFNLIPSMTPYVDLLAEYYTPATEDFSFEINIAYEFGILIAERIMSNQPLFTFDETVTAIKVLFDNYQNNDDEEDNEDMDTSVGDLFDEIQIFAKNKYVAGLKEIYPDLQDDELGQLSDALTTLNTKKFANPEDYLKSIEWTSSENILKKLHEQMNLSSEEMLSYSRMLKDMHGLVCTDIRQHVIETMNKLIFGGSEDGSVCIAMSGGFMGLDGKMKKFDI